MQAGTRLGPYEIVSPLGAGGMGEVWRARDTRLERDVAIKVVRPGLASDPDRLSRFEKEARAAAQLDHPNVLVVHDVGTHEGSPYIVSELLEGESLREKLGAPLPPKKAVDYAIQIAHGLAAAHEKGVVHRDIKPENVFVTKDGHVKILDFGVAKLLPSFEASGVDTETPTATATQPGTAVGTVAYMSPEQIRGQPVDARTDLFSLGVVLYEMLSGKRPFQRDTPAEIMTAILREEPPDLSETNRSVPAALEHIVRHCIEKEPDSRFQSARDVVFALEALPEVSTSRPPAPMSPTGVWLHRYRKSLAGATLLVVALALAWVLVLRGRNRTPVVPSLIRSIAVLPLANLSGDPGQEYFSDGMTEELIATLSKISALKVISRTSVMQFKGSKKPLREIAAALGVEGVIEGSVLRAGERVRINVQLINASTDTHLWAESYNRDLKDVLALQSDVARAVAGEVRAKLTSQEQTRLASSRAVNPEAYDLYLKGRHSLVIFDEEEFKKGLEHFQRAIDLDPTWAAAYAGLAGSYLIGGSRGYQPRAEANEKARTAVRKALELDEGLALAHVWLGMLMAAEWDWSGAERELQRGIALDPNRSSSHTQYAFYLMAIGKSEAAVAESKRALELDPLSPGLSFALGMTLHYARRYDESIVQFRKALEADPAGLGPMARKNLALNYAQKQMYTEAIFECDKALEGLPEDQHMLGGCGRVYGLAGRRQKALALLDQLKSLSSRHYVDPETMAFLYDGLGDNDRTMEWLERSYTEHSAGAADIRSELWTDQLRSDPHFQDLVRRMNYPASSSQ